MENMGIIFVLEHIPAGCEISVSTCTTGQLKLQNPFVEQRFYKGKKSDCIRSSFPLPRSVQGTQTTERRQRILKFRATVEKKEV